MLHINKENNNLYSQFFVEQQDKYLNKEIVAVKSSSKIVGSDTVKGPNSVKDRDEFVIQHKDNSPSVLQWRDYKFKVLNSVM